MPFEINPKRLLSIEVRHLMALQISRIEGQLRSGDPIDKRVHDARKRIKETRALLRLVRGVLDSQFAVENAWYRDAGHELSAARDAAALVEAAAKLRKHAKDRETSRSLSRVRRALRRQSNSDDAPRIEKFLEQLPDARDRLDKWPQIPDSFPTIGGGLQRTFRDARRALETIYDQPTPEAFHELRKRVKDHWYHAQLLRRVWPDFMERYDEVVEELADVLGDHHDLIVLRQTLTEKPEAYGNNLTLQSVFRAIEKRRQQLEKKAVKSAAHVFAEKPSAWCDRIEEWWRLAT